MKNYTFLSNKIKDYISSLTIDSVKYYGDKSDGTIQFITKTGKGNVEISYFFGDQKKKNIVVISSQVGCPEKCKFCYLGEEKFQGNLSENEMYDQVILTLNQAQKEGFNIDKIDHKVTIANSGEPLLNPKLIGGLEKIMQLYPSFKVSTIFPKGKLAQNNFKKMARFAANYNKPVQPQISLISTDEKYRKEMGKVASFKEIRDVADYWFKLNPIGRKINLSLILSQETPCDVKDICNIFPPELFRFRFRDYVETKIGQKNGLKIIKNLRMDQIENKFKEKGYDCFDHATPTKIERKYGLVANKNLMK